MKTTGAIFQGAEQDLKEGQYRMFSSGHQPKGTNDATRACLGTGACPKCLQFQFLHLKSNWQAGTRFVPDTDFNGSLQNPTVKGRCVASTVDVTISNQPL
jgi:hypothetical protein